MKRYPLVTGCFHLHICLVTGCTQQHDTARHCNPRFTAAISLWFTLPQRFHHRQALQDTLSWLWAGTVKENIKLSHLVTAIGTQHSYRCDNVRQLLCHKTTEFKICYRTWRHLSSFNQHKRNPFDSGQNFLGGRWTDT